MHQLTRRPPTTSNVRFLLTLALALAACAPASASWPPPGMLRIGSARPISHVVIVMQENRSFDNLFYGYPGANTATSGVNSKGETITLQPVPLEEPWNVDHEAVDFFVACDGHPRGRNCKMDGFNREGTFGQKRPKHLQYSYVPNYETKPYFAMAHQYVLADNMFASNIDESFESHQYIIAGQANHAVDGPVGEYGCGDPSAYVLTLTLHRTYGPNESPCFDSPTIASELEAKGLTWRSYIAPPSDLGNLWSAFRAISYVYNSNEYKTNVLMPPPRFLTDVAKGKLATVTWLTPTCLTSDHADCLGNAGPDWVGSVVNAIGESHYWNNTVVLIMWDEWGGWYDHVAPPYVDYDGLGFRVPLLVVSAYSKRNYISHVQYEHGSLLKFIEDAFGLDRLAASDLRANSIEPDCLDFSRAPRPFVPIHTVLQPMDFFRLPMGGRAPEKDID